MTKSAGPSEGQKQAAARFLRWANFEGNPGPSESELMASCSRQTADKAPKSGRWGQVHYMDFRVCQKRESPKRKVGKSMLELSSGRARGHRPLASTGRGRSPWKGWLSCNIMIAAVFCVPVAIGWGIAPALAQDGAPEPGAPEPGAVLPPHILNRVEPIFPAMEVSEPQTRVVVSRVTVDTQGHVAEVEIVESAGEAFDNAAKEALLQFLFSPATVDGQPIAVRILYRTTFELKPQVAEDASLIGVVRERGTGRPLAGVVVEIDGVAPAITDTEGRFEIADVPAGEVVVRLSGEGLSGVQTTEMLEAGTRLEVAYEAALAEEPGEDGEEDDFEIVVAAPPMRKEVISSTVKADEALLLPGTQGDVLKVVDSLPGVGRSTAGSGQLIVWGAAPQETRVFIHGVPVPRLYHQGGLRSVIHTDLVESVELVPGAYGAAYGRGLGGVVISDLRPLEDDGFRGSVSVDVLEASGYLKASLSDRVRLAAAGRGSYLDKVATPFVSDDVQDFFPFPRYADAQIKLDIELSPSERIEVGGLVSFDDVSRGVFDSDPNATTLQERSDRFARAFVRYETEPGDGSATVATLWAGYDTSEQSERAGRTGASISSSGWSAGLRASHHMPLAGFLTLEMGGDIEVVQSNLERIGSPAVPPREGDARVFGQFPPDQLAADEWTVLQMGAAPYAQFNFSFLDGQLEVTTGLRVDPNIRSLSRTTPRDGTVPKLGALLEDIAVEPRLSVMYRPLSWLAFKTAAARVSQPALSTELSAVFGNPRLNVARAWHVLVGVSTDITDSLNAELTAFGSFGSDRSIRNPDEFPALAKLLTDDGLSRVYGLQVSLRQQLWEGFQGWISYTLMRSARKDGEQADWRASDFDQRHVLTATASYAVGWGIDVGLRARFASGLPRTPVIGTSFDATNDRYFPILGRVNSIRLPSFFQLDVRVSKLFEIGSTTLLAYIEVQNATAHDNIEEFAFSRDYTRRGGISGLPVLPVAGMKWSF